MAGKQTALNAWMKIDPAKARAMIKKALESAKGDKKRAAKRLKVSYVTLWRSIRNLDMTKAVDSICEKWEKRNAKEKASKAAKNTKKVTTLLEQS